MDEINLNQEDIDTLVNLRTDKSLVSLKENHDCNDYYSQGRWDLVNYQSNTAILNLKKLLINESFSASTQLSDLLTIDIILAGGADTQFDHINLKNDDMPRIIFSSHAKNNNQKRIHAKGERLTALGIWIRPEVLIEKFGLDIESFPQLPGELLQGKYNRSLVLPVTAVIKHCVEEIFDCQLTGKIHEKFIEAKVTELFCYLIECLGDPEKAFNLSNHLSTRKSTAMKKVVNRLNMLDDDTVCLSSLAQEVGMSPSSLSKTFKSSYGMNISTYMQQKKLVKGFDLVLDGKLSMLQVALEIGYKDQSSFARAFKSYFGFKPSYLRLNHK